MREHLADRLPLFMVPAGIVVLDALPLTPVGKLDRRALPAPTIEVDSDHVDAETPVEQQLATIIAGLLGLERVSVSDSFFALGGDSIMSIQVASAARAAGIDVSPEQTKRAVQAMAGAQDGSNAVAGREAGGPEGTSDAGGETVELGPREGGVVEDDRSAIPVRRGAADDALREAGHGRLLCRGTCGGTIVTHTTSARTYRGSMSDRWGRMTP